MNPLEHFSDEDWLDVDGFVDDPECELGTVNLGAAFQVNTAQSPCAVGAEDGVGES